MSIETIIQVIFPVLGSMLVGFFIFYWFVNRQPDRQCPDCQTPLPKLRKATSLKQGLQGGWTCENCGVELDSRGRKA